MKRVQKILVLFTIMLLLFALKAFASIDQSKVTNYDDAACNIAYNPDGHVKSCLFINGAKNYSNQYKYIMVLTNNTSDEPEVSYNAEKDEYESNIGLCRELDDYNEVPGVDTVLEQNGDIRGWIYAYEEDHSSNPELIKGNLSVSRPDLPDYTKETNDFFVYGNSGISIPISYPRDMWTKRSMRIIIGEIKDYDLLLKIKNGDKNSSEELNRYAKQNNNVVIDTKVDTPSVGNNVYYTGYRCDENIPAGLILKDKIEQDKYYYAHIVFDNENGKYADLEVVIMAQAENSSIGLWGLYPLDSTNFDWDGLDEYTEEEEDDTTTEEPEENIVENEINETNNVISNNIINNTINNNTTIDNTTAPDNTVSESELPYTGLQLTALYLVFILLCYIYRKYKKLKNI